MEWENEHWPRLVMLIPAVQRAHPRGALQWSSLRFPSFLAVHISANKNFLKEYCHVQIKWCAPICSNLMCLHCHCLIYIFARTLQIGQIIQVSKLMSSNKRAFSLHNSTVHFSYRHTLLQLEMDSITSQTWQ